MCLQCVQHSLILVSLFVAPRTILAFTLKAMQTIFLPPTLLPQLAIGHHARQRNTTAAFTHKGGSRSHTCRAARCRDTEAPSWKMRVRTTLSRAGLDRRSPLCLFSFSTLTILDLMSGCGRALIPPPTYPHKHLTAHAALGGTVPFTVMQKTSQRCSQHFPFWLLKCTQPSLYVKSLIINNAL